MSFVRRFQTWPGTSNLALIEGVAIIDLPAPGSLTGVNSGIAALIGEFADCSSILSVDSSGHVSASYKAIEVIGSQLLYSLFGGFDETLGDFGGQCGNGFVELRNKVFAGGRLVIVPINIASDRASRFWRQLPVCRSLTNPLPNPPIQPGTVLAGREFVDSTPYRLRICKTFSFAGTAAYASDTNLTLAHAGSTAATQPVTRAAGSFITDGVAIGDAIVIGTTVTPSSSLGTSAGGTYRVVSIDSATQLTVERQDGHSFDWAAASSVPWRIHTYDCADSGRGILSDNAACTIPVRPLTHTITAASPLTPVLVPAAQTATAWDTLSGLSGATHHSDSTTYTAAIQAVRPVAVADDALMTEYQKAFDCLLSEEDPANLPSLLWSARKFKQISAMGQNHVIAAAQQGHGRMWFSSPSLSAVQSITDVATSTDNGVASYPSRNERRVYSWPGVRTLVPEAKGFALKGADGNLYSDGVLDVGWDGWEVAVATNLNPERSIGEEIPPATEVLAPTIGLQRGVAVLNMDDYITLKQLGVSAPFKDKTVGMVIQSAITTSLVDGQTQINRRRMADYIEESLASLMKPYSKRLLTESLKDVILTTATGFLESLKKPSNPDDQRIQDYVLDSTSLNTPELSKAGIYALSVRVETLGTADVIALQCSIGKGVLTITAAV